MPTLIDPRERFLHRAALYVLLASGAASAFAALVHANQPEPRLIDLLLPGACALLMLSLATWLQLRPVQLMAVVWCAYGIGLVAIGAPAWYYAWTAAHTPGGSLIETLPPITSALLPLALVLIVFARPRQVLVAAAIAWVVIATPILAYLATHPLELRSPRGLDMVMTLGPVMLLVMVILPFHRGVERWVASLQQERARAEALAERDSLTGLYNRRAGEGALANLVAEPADEDALILFDLDRFKDINDRHGHAIGDEVLRQVARRCEQVLRSSDLFARWGGEEFLVLARGAREEGSLRVAEALRRAIAASPIEPVGTVTASFGVARFRSYDTLATWLRRADAALYAAKDGGRNRVIGAPQ